MDEILPIGPADRDKVVRLIAEHWGSALIVTRGRLHDANTLSGYVAVENEEIKGIITYHVENKACEIVSLDSLEENRGIGGRLIERVIETARKAGCDSVWLITTNDNTHALRFYQKRGFNLKALYPNAIEESRKYKPQIPEYGFDGIPILHEIEFEYVL